MGLVLCRERGSQCSALHPGAGCPPTSPPRRYHETPSHLLARGPKTSPRAFSRPAACFPSHVDSNLENVQRAIQARSSGPPSSLVPCPSRHLRGESPRNAKAPGASFTRAGACRGVRVYKRGETLLRPPLNVSLCRVSSLSGIRKRGRRGSAGSSSGRRLLIKLREPSGKFFKSKNHTQAQ